MKKLAITMLAMLAIASSAFAASDVVISQVYGGGGNSGSTYKNDFVEIFNRGICPVDISTWSIQYASATGSFGGDAFRTNLSGTLQPGQHFLVQEAAGTGGTTSLPTPDATGSIAMSATAGKVALVSVQTNLSGTCPTTNVVDFVGFGSTANCFEGTGPTPAPSNTNAVLRAVGGGCTDTDQNAADFAAGAPNPRNTATSFAPCSGQLCATPTMKSTWGTLKTLYR